MKGRNSHESRSIDLREHHTLLSILSRGPTGTVGCPPCRLERKRIVRRCPTEGAVELKASVHGENATVAGLRYCVYRGHVQLSDTGFPVKRLPLRYTSERAGAT